MLHSPEGEQRRSLPQALLEGLRSDLSHPHKAALTVSPGVVGWFARPAPLGGRPQPAATTSGEAHCQGPWPQQDHPAREENPWTSTNLSALATTQDAVAKMEPPVSATTAGRFITAGLLEG